MRVATCLNPSFGCFSGRSRWLYCYDDLVPYTDAPRLTLPYHFTIITHHEELRSKNTGVQAAIVAPQQVSLHSLEDLPDFDKSRAVVLFPSEDACTVDALDVTELQHVIIIDSR